MELSRIEREDCSDETHDESEAAMVCELQKYEGDCLQSG